MKTNFQTGNFLRLFTAVSVFLLFVAGCSPTKLAGTSKGNLMAGSLRPFGRTILTNNQSLELVSSAAHFGFSFDGNECRLVASVPSWLDHNYLQYELDGQYQRRLRVSSKTADTLVLKTSSAGRHTVWIYKATEATTGPVIIQQVIGKNAMALQRPSAPLIEFIGNSITCGAAADPSEVPCGKGVYHDQHNAYMAYGPRVARALGINYIVSGVSGIGMYRNWNSDGPTMPQVYQKTTLQPSASNWDFTKYSPNIVSIALGTNDFSHGDGKKARLPFDSAAFVDAYVPFVQLVKSNYPAAQIALLTSAMMNGDARTLLQNCLTAVKQKVDALNPSAKPVALFFFPPMQARGCGGHPSVEDHAVLAEELLPFFQRLLQ